MRLLRNFAAVALAGVAQAQFETLYIQENGSWYYSYYQNNSHSSAAPGVDNFNVELQMNSNIFVLIAEDTTANYQPDLRGGSVSYTVDLSTMGCGCVAGAYFVGLDANCTKEPLTSDPSCKTIDLMQADRYSFNASANPCDGGVCDPVSQCRYDMEVDGQTKYGNGVYGPGGSIINTDAAFDVKTEVLSTGDYSALWGLKTTLSQNGQTMVLEADCQGYIEVLTSALGGNMAVSLSTWDNLDNREPSFPRSANCPAVSPSCSGASATFTDLTFLLSGSNVDPPQPPVENVFQDLAVSVDGQAVGAFVKGLDERDLSTSGNQVTIGHDNRAFVFSVDDDSTVNNTLKPGLYGGTLSWTMDVSNVQCRCAAGIFLADLSDGTCDFSPVAEGFEPSCTYVDLLRANINGFTSRFGDLCTWNAELCGATAYGEGASYDIDSTRAYDVSMQFYKAFDDSALTRIVGTLSQDAQSVSFELANTEELAAIADALNSGMSIAINNQVVEATEITDVGCYVSCSGASATFSNLSWTSNDAIEEDVTPPTPPTPQPQPATFEAFTAVSDTTSQTVFYAKGQDDRTLTTAGSEITIGEDNRAFVFQVDNDSTVMNTYKHNLYGGTLSFDVDASGVGCGCYGGLALAALNDNTCSFADIESGACALTELFEANINGFESYIDEQCAISSDQIQDGYGPGSAFWIDSTLPYTVQIKFYKEHDNSVLTRVVTNLEQNGFLLELTKECTGALASLQSVLDGQMSLAITNKALANPADVSSVTCSETCTSSSLSVGNIEWQSNNSQEVPDIVPTLVEVGPAPRQDSGDCGSLCAECTEYYYDNDENTPIYQCTKEGNGQMRFGNKCSATRQPRHCGSGDQPCLWSYPYDDPDKWNSVDGACRNLPDSYNDVIGVNNDWDFNSKVKPSTKHLCGWNGCSGTCHMSWPAGDSLRGQGPYALIRCWPLE